VSEKDLRISTANRCKDLGVKITGKGGVAGKPPLSLFSLILIGESMDVFTVCNVLQAIGVLEDAAINPPSTSKEPATPVPPEPNDPASPQPSLTSPKLLQHDPSRSLSTIPISSLSTPTTTTSIPSEIPDRLSSGPPDLSQILRSSTPILPISFEGGECSTPLNTAIPSISSLSNPLDPSVKKSTEVKGETSSETPTTLLSPTGPTQLPPSSAIHPPQFRSTYGSQVESSLTARWEKQLRDYLKDLRCRKISHIMGRESYHGGPGSNGLNSRVGSSNRSMNSGPAAVSRSSVPMSLPAPASNQSMNPVAQSSSLDEEEFEEDDETTNNSQSTTPPLTPLGIAVPPAPATGLSIILPQTTSQSKQTITTPRDPSVCSVPKLSSPTAAPLQTGMLSPTASTGNTAPAAPAAASASVVKDKKPVMRRFTGSTRGGWTFPTPVTSPNDFGISQYDIFLNPQEVLTKWSQICYEENKAEEIEECLLRQIAAKCGLSLPIEPFRIGTQYLSPEYRVSLTKTRSGSISQIPGELLSGSRPRSRSSSISTNQKSGGPKQHHTLSHHHPENSTLATNTSSSSFLSHHQQQQQNVDKSSSSFPSPHHSSLIGEIKKSVPIVGGVYDETSSWTATNLIEKAKRNQFFNRGKIFQRKPRFDDPSSSSNYFFSESHSSLLTSPRHHSTPLNHIHGFSTPLDPPSSRKRSRSGSSLSTSLPTSSSALNNSNRPYCPIMLLYDSLYRDHESTNTDQSAGPDICPITGRLSLVDIIINTRPIPWVDIAKQFNILQIEEDLDFVSQSQSTEDLSSSSKTQLFPIGHNLNGSIGTWVDIRVDSDGGGDDGTGGDRNNKDIHLKSDEMTKERRGRKKFSSSLSSMNDESAMDERRPKRLQRHSSVSSLNGLNDDERKNYRQEFRRVSFADVVAPSFREVKNYDLIYLSSNARGAEGDGEGDTLEEDPSGGDVMEDLSDEAFLKRHEETLKRMREKWAQIQELKDSLKRSNSNPSTSPSDKIHHASPRHSNSHSHRSSKSPSTSHEKTGRKLTTSRNSMISTAAAGGSFDHPEVEVTPKRRRGRQSLPRTRISSESTTVTAGTVGNSRNRRTRVSSPVEVFSGSVDSLQSMKKRNIKEVTSAGAGAGEHKASDPSRPRKRGRPPKYHPPQPSTPPPPLPPPPSEKSLNAEKSLKKVESGPSTRLSSPSSSSRPSPADHHHSLGQFSSSDVDTLAIDVLRRSGSKRHRSLDLVEGESEGSGHVASNRDHGQEEQEREENRNVEDHGEGDNHEGDEVDDDDEYEDDQNESEDF
jgi:hypothetical protein